MIKRTNSSFKPFQRKSFYLTATFFFTPAVIYSVMSGAFSEQTPLFLTVAAIFFIMLAVLCVYDRKNIKGAVIAAVVLFAAFMSSFVSYNAEYMNTIRLSAYAGDDVHRFTGYTAKEDADTGSLMFIELTSVDGKRIKDTVTVQTFNNTGYYLKNGAYLEFDARLKLADENDVRTYEWLKSRGVHGVLYGITQAVPVCEKDKFYAAEAVKNFFSGRMLKITGLIPQKEKFEKTFSISTAMMFGDKSRLNVELKNQFSRSGIIHILCVSGLHFSIILAGFSCILKYTVYNRRIREVVIIAAAIAYLFLCGFTKSAVRASVMSLIGSMSISGVKKNTCTYALLLSVCVICISDPYSVFDNGFKMSCVCCAGILCSSLICEKLCVRLMYYPVLSMVISSLLVSFSASAFLFPYSLAAFDGASTVSVAASAVSVIPAQLFLILCFIASFVSLADIGIFNLILSALLSGLCGFICKVAEFFSGLKFSYIEYEMPDISFWIFMLVLFGAAVVSGTKHRAVSVYLYTVSASVILTVAVFISGAV